ncbi:hypothetical protein [Aliamphritea spongicola]|nr:hypothetical protein [Aliamphritea spongicola]
MNRLIETVTEHCRAVAQQHSLSISFEWNDIFAASRNDSECADYVARAASEYGQPVQWLDEPFRWSEDFGAISAASRGLCSHWAQVKQRHRYTILTTTFLIS